jgi:RES domain-containing protein
MRPASHAETPSVADVVRRAVAICDPDGADEVVTDLMLAYEDSDEPVTALEGRDREFFETAERVQGLLPGATVQMAAAVATYLAFRRDEAGDDDADLLRRAARAEFGDNPPGDVALWLQDAGVTV